MARFFAWGHRPARWPVSVSHLWPLTVLLGIFAFLNTHPIRPHDFWWHMAVGREILATGHIPSVDTFSFTAAGTPYPSYAAFWLPEVMLYDLYTLGGPALVVFVHSLTVTAAYGLTTALAWRISGSPRIAAVATLFAAALGINDWNVRPQAFTFFLAPLFLWAVHEIRWRRLKPASLGLWPVVGLRRPNGGGQTGIPSAPVGGGEGEEGGTHPAVDDRRRWFSRSLRWLAVFPLGMALWVNCHGSFPLGLLIVGLWVADEVWGVVRGGEGGRGSARPLPRIAAAASALALAAAASLLNPRGPRAFSYLAGMSVHPVIQGMVPEWAPPTFSTLTGALFLTGLLATAALLAISPRRPEPLDLLLFLAFGALGLRTTRGAVWFGLALAPVWAAHVSAVFGTPLRSVPDYERPFVVSHEAPRAEGARAEAKRSGVPRAQNSTPLRSVPDDKRPFVVSHEAKRSGVPKAQNGTPLRSVPDYERGYKRDFPATLLAVMLTAGALVTLPWFKERLPFPPAKAGLISAETPVAATEFLLRERPPGPLFHAMPFGSYLVWAAQPEYPVFVDSRIELYPVEVWLDYLHISAAGCGWEERLARYGVRTLMLSPQEQPALVAAARASPHWHLVYEDTAAVIFVSR